MKSLLAALSLVLVAACGSQDSTPDAPATSTAPTQAATAGPAAAVEKLMRALDAGDCDVVLSVVVTPSAIDCDDVAAAKDSFAEEGTDLDAVRYKAGPVNGTSSHVTIDWGNENPGESYDVEKIDGQWRVVFDSVA